MPFFDSETKEFLLSVARDAVKSIAVLVVDAAFYAVAKLFQLLVLPSAHVEFLEGEVLYFGVAIIFVSGVDLIGKMGLG